MITIFKKQLIPKCKLEVNTYVHDFSRSVANAFTYFGLKDKAEIIETINDAFDVLNSANPNAFIKLKSGLGTYNKGQIT